VIRIRYTDFSSGSHNLAGLYGVAEHCPHGVTVHLLPGLTGLQRKAVIRRLRQEASRDCGPPLPLPQLLVALCADRVRVAVRLAAAVVRLHPAAALLPAGFVAVAMTLFVLASTDGGLGPGHATRPGLAGAYPGTGYAGPVVDVGGGTIGLVSAGGAGPGGVIPIGTALNGTALNGTALNGAGAGGRGLGSGHAVPTRRVAQQRRPRAARICFGAMPGIAPLDAGHGKRDGGDARGAGQPGQLACRRARSES